MLKDNYIRRGCEQVENIIVLEHTNYITIVERNPILLKHLQMLQPIQGKALIICYRSVRKVKK